jgi:hypothetical protein
MVKPTIFVGLQRLVELDDRLSTHLAIAIVENQPRTGGTTPQRWNIDEPGGGLGGQCYGEFRFFMGSASHGHVILVL